MATLVFSYSHADEALRNELETHLSPLQSARGMTDVLLLGRNLSMK